MNVLLTIVIPTYNRKKHLLKNINTVLDQLSEEVELIILDNASDYDVSAALQKKIENSNQIKCLRNTYNIGLHANIVKCFEICKTPWLYIIGDDDELRPNSISKIIEDIQKHPEAVNISYKWQPEKKWLTPRNLELKGFQEYISTIESIHHVMFLSSNLYNAQLLNKKIREGYYYQMSGAPHLAMLLTYLAENKNSKVILKETYLVNNFNSEVEEQDKWDKPIFFRNIKLLLDIPISLKFKQQLFLKYKERYSLKKYFKFYLKQSIKSKEITKNWKDFNIGVSYYKVYGSFYEKSLIKLAYFFFKFSFLIKKKF